METAQIISQAEAKIMALRAIVGLLRNNGMVWSEDEILPIADRRAIEAEFSAINRGLEAELKTCESRLFGSKLDILGSNGKVR